MARNKHRKPTLTKIAKAQARVDRMRADAVPLSERPLPGRPTLWSVDLESKLFSRLAKGRTLSAICRDDADMPDMITVFRWRENDPDFFQRLLGIRKLQSHVLVDQTLEIANDAVADKDMIARDRLRIGTRQWIAEKFNREDYGERPAQNVQINGPVTVTSDERAKILDELRANSIDGTIVESRPQLSKEK